MYLKLYLDRAVLYTWNETDNKPIYIKKYKLSKLRAIYWCIKHVLICHK